MKRIVTGIDYVRGEATFLIEDKRKPSTYRVFNLWNLMIGDYVEIAGPDEKFTEGGLEVTVRHGERWLTRLQRSASGGPRPGTPSKVMAEELERLPAAPPDTRRWRLHPVQQMRYEEEALQIVTVERKPAVSAAHDLLAFDEPLRCAGIEILTDFHMRKDVIELWDTSTKPSRIIVTIENLEVPEGW